MDRFRFSLLLIGLALGACRSETSQPTTGSETHFLSRCPDSIACGEGLECVCGVCTQSCSTVGACQSLAPAAACVAIGERPEALACTDAQVAASCEVACDAQAQCAPLGRTYRCDRGLCRQLAADCETAQVAASDVVLLGDLFLAQTGQVTAELEALARDAGALGAGESYRDYSSTLVTPFGGGDDPATQYQTARAEGSLKVVIMDAGGPDALLTCPDPPAPTCPALENAISSTYALLDQMANEGVEHVVLFFYPDPEEASLGAKFDVLRTELQAGCEASAVRCHFLDLRPIFAAQTAYLEDGGILPTQAGSTATAAAIWSLMQEHCVAQ